MQVYLSGAIEYAPDHGRAWRAEVSPLLRDAGYEVYDPALDELKNLSEEERLHFRSWKQADLARFQRTLRKIIAYDLDWIETRADLVLCYWDEHCLKGAGTQGELTFAHRLGKPVLLVAGMPVSQISGWILGCSTEVFSDFAGASRYLQRARLLSAQ